MKTGFAFSKRRKLLLGTVGIIGVLIVSSMLFLNTSQFTQAATIQPHPGLVGWWRFDEGSGTIAGDSSGNGNNGTLNGSPLPSWVAGKFGDALSFGGSADSDSVTVPDTPSLRMVSTDFSVSFWIYPEDGITAFQGVICKGTANSAGWNIVYYGSTKTLNFWCSSGTFTQVAADSNEVPNNAWTFCTVIYHYNSGSPTVSFYFNGVLDKTLSVGTIASGTAALNIGWTDSGWNAYFTGVLDEVQIYNRALSATEIQTDFQQSPDLSPYLLANVPQGTTQVITTLSWQGTGNINATITTPSQTYTESMMSEYQKTTYSTTGGGPPSMLNIKRLSISVTALTSAQTWNITLTYDNTVSAYQISVETQN
ncbi:MAG: LamG domain-containing protein [Candidatus Bathyarchaeia archaeon]